MIAACQHILNQRPHTNATDAYDGPEPDPYDGWTERDLNTLADQRAAQEFYGGQS
jgi:hypothetical protein